MIAALSGAVLFKSEDTLVIDVGGVGYEVSATSSVMEKAGPAGASIKVLVFTDVKEQSISLFGFESAIEKEVFLLLKKVKGIGARLSLTIVSFIGAERLLSSIGQSDIDVLKSVPGVGKKTAERMILELQEQVTELAFGGGAPGLASQVVKSKVSLKPSQGALKGTVSSVEHDVVLALERLGFPTDRAREAVIGAMEEKGESADSSELLRSALASL